MFSLPPVAGVLLDRELIVEVADAGGGKTAIRVDGQVGWQPIRRASDLVPATSFPMAHRGSSGTLRVIRHGTT
jgi:hypothetical protein